jgi:hypothetical protein
VARTLSYAACSSSRPAVDTFTFLLDANHDFMISYTILRLLCKSLIIDENIQVFAVTSYSCISIAKPRLGCRMVFRDGCLAMNYSHVLVCVHCAS